LSPLTKLFVVLLVITSMCTTAGFIVFVENVRPVQPRLDEANSALAAARQQAAQNLQAKEQAEAQRDSALADAESQRAAAATSLSSLQSQLNQSNVQIAQLQAEKTNLEANVNTLTSNLTLTAATASKLQDQVTGLRTTNDELVKRAEDDSRKLADLNSQTETLATNLSATQEKLAAEQEENQKYSAWVKDHGGDPVQVVGADTTPTGIGAPAINGHVTDTGVIHGNLYVTLSVGSADGVQRGMQFNVVDPASGQFLGIVTVDSVDSDTSSGKIEGDPDKIAQVHAGNDAKTQLRD
jgi:multidrug efflux pump subunit AcrA (membrane-fusion protein)